MPKCEGIPYPVIFNYFFLVNTEEASASTGEISDTDDQKFTRAQRKRLRKSKLKEAALQRRKIIGPLLPASNEEIDPNHVGVEVVNNCVEGVRQNAATRLLGEISFKLWIEYVVL